MNPPYDPSSYQYGSRTGSPRGSVGSMGMQPNTVGTVGGHAQMDGASDASFHSRQQGSAFQQPAMNRQVYGEDDDRSIFSHASQAQAQQQVYRGYSNESLPGRRASGAPLLENYSGPLDAQYSGPLPYSNQYHSGPLQPPHQQPMQYSGPVPQNYSQPIMDPNMGHYGPGTQSAGGEHARLAVLHGMILNDLNSVRRKVVDYMETARSRSHTGSDSQDPLERARVQDALAQLEQQQMLLGSMLQQNGIDTQNLPIEQSILGSRAGSIAGDIPDINSTMSYGQREAAIQNAIQRLQQQQQNMMHMMNQEGIQPDMSQMGYDQNVHGAIREHPDMDENDEEEEPDPYDAKPYQRKTKLNWPGLIIFVLFMCAFGFYMYIRIRFTLDIGVWLFYGIIVLIGEIIGAFAVFLYAMCIIVKPLDENARRDPNKAPPKPKYRYHIRVIVPCYSESLAILQRTIMASYNATLPPGCTRTVYLCDDGKDNKKREWVESLDADDVVYVSGRKRKPGEMNGKSCNINNCLQQIYPKNPKQGMISMREVICVFDADQVASQEFFLKTVHLLDGGSDVAMILSPQCFYNINPGADIFNNSNIHFWEYMQPGYDAMGFISCTGTNFLCRARAIQECGWFPEDTVTEDFGLGIQLTKLGWKCRYVQEYLAIGEAPEEVRNTFQQRSRWCKGHFQILFSAKCPLFDRGMPFFHRVMSCASVFSYMVNCLTTPLLFLVPIISIWFGIFPIALNFWFALGITVYGVSLFLVQNYHHTFRHLKVLWFANLGNTLLWTVYFKAMVNTSIARCWKGTITFKTTSKGGGGRGPSALRDLWIHILMFLVSFVTVIIGLVGLSAEINLPLVISIIFALYNCVPYYLVIHYAYLGRKTSLKVACLIGMMMQNILQLLAIILVWVLLPRNYDYEQALKLSIEFFETQRSGPLMSAELQPSSRHLEWREASAESDVASANGGDLVGGWYVTGLDGHVKYTVAIAYTVTMLCWGYREFAGAFAEANNRAYTLNNIKWATDYLIKTHNNGDGTNPSGETQGIVWYVGNVTAEQEEWIRPEAITTPREGIYIIDGVQVFTSVSAAFSSCHRALADVRQEYADELLMRSISLYSFSKSKMTDENSLEDISVRGNIELQGEEVIDPNAGFVSETRFDDMLWAAAWLNLIADDYTEEVNEWYDMAEEERMPNRYLFNFDDLFIGANMVLLQKEEDNSDVYKDTVETFLKQWVCGEPEDIDYTTRGRAQNMNDPALASTVNVAFFALMYSKMVKGKDNQKYVGYRCWAMSQARYILGDNANLGNGYSFLIGYGSNYPTQIYDRASSCEPIPKECSITQKTASDPNPQVLNGALVHGPRNLTDSLVDIRDEGNVDTMVRLDWNAAVPGMFAGLVDLGGSWAECLQGYGTEISYHPICNPL